MSYEFMTIKMYIHITNFESFVILVMKEHRTKGLRVTTTESIIR
jgi:hypothetical protein